MIHTCINRPLKGVTDRGVEGLGTADGLPGDGVPRAAIDVPRDRPEGASQTHIALPSHVLGSKIILVHGCDNIAGKLRQMGCDHVTEVTEGTNFTMRCLSSIFLALYKI